jgi:hypothetical protein
MHFLKHVSEDFWWDVAQQCDYATFYHTPLWKEVAVRTFPRLYKDETFGAILPSGVRVVFPLVSKRRIGPLRWLHSTFENCYGGFIADGPVRPDEAAAIYQHVNHWTTYTFYNITNPLATPLAYEVISRLTLVYSEPTFIVKLDADFDTVFSRFVKNQRNIYRKGIKNGVQIRLATTLDDYRAYYTCYRDAVDRWGEGEQYGYKWHLFENIYRLSQRYPDQIKLWVMIVDEKIVGGELVFYWGKIASIWSGTALRDFLSYHVMPVADTEIIRDAIDRNISYVDFNTSGQKEGVMAYKSKFGAEQRSVSMWRFENPMLKPAQQIYWKATGNR